MKSRFVAAVAVLSIFSAISVAKSASYMPKYITCTFTNSQKVNCTGVPAGFTVKNVSPVVAPSATMSLFFDSAKTIHTSKQGVSYTYLSPKSSTPFPRMIVDLISQQSSIVYKDPSIASKWTFYSNGLPYYCGNFVNKNDGNPEACPYFAG